MRPGHQSVAKFKQRGEARYRRTPGESLSRMHIVPYASRQCDIVIVYEKLPVREVELWQEFFFYAHRLLDDDDNELIPGLQIVFLIEILK